MQVTVLCFAQLKEFFSEQSELELERDPTVQSACQKLLESLSVNLRGQAAALISACKFSVEDEFVEKSFRLEEGMVLCLLPPPSGG